MLSPSEMTRDVLHQRPTYQAQFIAMYLRDTPYIGNSLT